MNDLPEKTERQPRVLKPKFPSEVVVLRIDYSPGEKMTYEIAITMKRMGQEFSYIMTYQIEILDEEDGNYTMRQTWIASDLLYQTYSITVKIDEGGRIVEFLDVPPEFQQTASFMLTFIPGNGFYFPREEAKVGDSWQIPIDMETEAFNATGTINNRITGTRGINVPAGTYDVFELEVTSSEFTIVYEAPKEPNRTEIEMTMKGYEYLERGTCRVVEAKFEQSTSLSMRDQTTSMSMTLHMRLMEHTKRYFDNESNPLFNSHGLLLNLVIAT